MGLFDDFHPERGARRSEHELSEEERRTEATSYALAFVNRRERTVSEVREHLARRGVSERISDAVIDEFGSGGLVDDARYAEMYVSDKRALESWGRERIRRGLLERGVDRDLVERALDAPDPVAGAPSGEDRDATVEPGVAGAGDPPPATPSGTLTVGELRDAELTRALALLQRRYPDPQLDRRTHERALAMLIRRGYESDLALDALRAHRWDS